MKVRDALRGTVGVGRALLELAGTAPAPFAEGAHLELVTARTNRLVRGVVLVAGQRMAQLDVSNIGEPMKINLIAYADVSRVRPATKGRRNGNWAPTREGRRAEELAGSGDWQVRP